MSHELSLLAAIALAVNLSLQERAGHWDNEKSLFPPPSFGPGQRMEPAGGLGSYRRSVEASHFEN